VRKSGVDRAAADSDAKEEINMKHISSTRGRAAPGTTADDRQSPEVRDAGASNTDLISKVRV
jgi:hypothetical protein